MLHIFILLYIQLISYLYLFYIIIYPTYMLHIFLLLYIQLICYEHSTYISVPNENKEMII